MSFSKFTSFTFLSNASSLLFISQTQNCSKSTLQIFRTTIASAKTFKSSPNQTRVAIPQTNAINNASQIRCQNSKSSQSKVGIDKSSHRLRKSNTVNSRENFYSSETAANNSKIIAEEASKKSIFKRFKEAYRQHGKVLVFVHIATCCGWIIGLFFLSKSGYDITKILDFFEAAHIISNETNKSVIQWIQNFSMEKFLRGMYCDKIFSDDWIRAAGERITGDTLKHILTAIMLYKIFTPLRYLLTLTLTKTMISVFKTKGIIPARPPPGHSIQEMYVEKKFIYQKRLANQRVRYLKEKKLLQAKLEKSKLQMKKTFKD